MASSKSRCFTACSHLVVIPTFGSLERPTCGQRAVHHSVLVPLTADLHSPVEANLYARETAHRQRLPPLRTFRDGHSENHPRRIDNDKRCTRICLVHALVSTRTHSQSISTKQTRTVLYHPLTPFFVLFCNVVASSNEQDFQLLEIVAGQLDKLADLSPPIAKLQTLFKSFIELCAGLIAKRRNSTSPCANGQESIPITECVPDLVYSQGPSPQASTLKYGLLNVADEYDDQNIPSTQAHQEETISDSYDNEPGMLDPGWELFDTQPTLDWLDADFS